MPSLFLLFIGSAVAALASSFDYVIVGAGTSGLVIANRLTEDPSVTVAVVEAGGDERNNPLVTIPDNFQNALTSSVVWNYTSIPQSGADNREIRIRFGRAWGGTSTINGMTYIRANKEEIDAWEELGNTGWNWDALLPYYKKSEEYITPSETQVDAGATYEIDNHGLEGPVKVAYTADLVNVSTVPLITQTWEGLSVMLSPDLNGGDTRGFALGPQTRDSTTNTRWDAARAYLHPVEGRPNLKIIQGSVESLTWAKAHPSSCEGLVASGVRYLTPNNESVVLKAKREVILSAGTIRSPGILERILKSLGIETKINLPTVGENLLEQSYSFIFHIASVEGLEGIASAYQAYVTAEQLFGSDVDAVAATMKSQIPTWAQAIADESGSKTVNVSAVERLMHVQHDLLFEKNIPACEILVIALSDGLFASQVWPLFPFSRGSIHLSSTDKVNDPLIDPRLFFLDVDMDMMLATIKMTRKFFTARPIADVVGGLLMPDLGENATDEEWAAFARRESGTNAHPFGTASMMSRELGGVVDPELRVYGTANVRVIDASIVPLQISGHPTATLYAIAERAADIIKGFV